MNEETKNKDVELDEGTVEEETSQEDKIGWHKRDLRNNIKKFIISNLDVTVILVSFHNGLFDFNVEIHKKY